MKRNAPTVFLIPLIIVLLAALLVGYNHYRQQQAATALQATYQQALSIGSAGNHLAPEFRLTDQHGQSLTLSYFRGKVVVLSFIDPECVDVCPVLSAEFRDASTLLGAKNANVAFLAVNVNPYHASTADMFAYSTAHGLNSLENWHFVSGSASALKAIWHDYGIMVKPVPTGDIQHSSFVFFIDKTGHEVYLAGATANKAAISTWAHGITFYANQLLA